MERGVAESVAEGGVGAASEQSLDDALVAWRGEEFAHAREDEKTQCGALPARDETPRFATRAKNS